jgi:hypothetical protein
MYEMYYQSHSIVRHVVEAVKQKLRIIKQKHFCDTIKLTISKRKKHG